MLSDALKQQIQQAYTQFLNNKGLKARYGQKLMIAEIAKTLGAIELDDQNVRQSEGHVCVIEAGTGTDRKSTRLNSSHVAISYAVFCLKKKKTRSIDSTTKAYR